MALVKFYNSLNQTGYNAVVSKDPNALYFISDGTHPVYLGEKKVSDTFEVFVALPAVEDGVQGKLYVVNNAGTVTAYIFDGTAYQPVAAAPVEKVMVDVAYNTATSVLTFEYSDGTDKEIDLPLESVIQDVAYDPETKILTFTLVSGATTQISLLDLVDAYSGDTTDSGTITVASDGKITFNLKIDPASGNAVVLSEDGLYVPVPLVYTGGTTNTATVAVNSTTGVVGVNVKIDPAAGNILTSNVDGLRVEAQSPLTAGETNSAKVTIASDEVTVDVKVSATADNKLSVEDDGLFVAPTNISNKMDKVVGATANDIAALNAAGEVVDSGKAFATVVREAGAATDTIVVTEAAVRSAVDAAITWQ